MATNKAGKNLRGKKARVKTVNLKRETIKDLSAREKKKVRGAGGAPGGVLQDDRLR